MLRRSFLPALACSLALTACGSSSKKSASVPTQPTSPAPTTTTVEPSTSTRATTATTVAPDLGAVHVALTSVVTGLERPLAAVWRAADQRMYVAEQPGRVRIVDTNGDLLPTPVLTLTGLAAGNEEGLLGITFSADGTKLYTDSTTSDNAIHVDEYTMNGDVAVPSSKRSVLVQPQPASNHKGGEVILGPDGMLYVGLGDGGFEGDPSNYGQNKNVLFAKILRINPNANGTAPYTVPADNPWVGLANRRPETWMWGLRNPWRFSFDKTTGGLWIGDVGQNTYEEIDDAPAGTKGTNFGWSKHEGFHTYKSGSVPDARDPILEKKHSDGYCAIVGGYVYRGTAIANLGGAYLFGDNCNSSVTAVSTRGATVVAQQDLGIDVQQLTSFGEDPSGELYVVSRTGTIYKLTAASA